MSLFFLSFSGFSTASVMVSAILYITLQLLNCSGLGLECHGGLGLAVCGLGLVVYGLGLCGLVNILVVGLVVAAMQHYNNVVVVVVVFVIGVKVKGKGVFNIAPLTTTSATSSAVQP